MLSRGKPIGIYAIYIFRAADPYRIFMRREGTSASASEAVVTSNIG
jgi:hypothetical protein